MSPVLTAVLALLPDEHKQAVGGRGIGRQAAGIAGENDVHREEALAQQASRLEGVAAVVAGTGQHQHRPFAVDGQFAGEIGGRQPGALHQRPVGVLRLDAAQRGTEEEGVRVHGVGRAYFRIIA